MDGITYTRETEKFSGSVTLPDPEDLSTAAFNSLAEIEDEINLADEDDNHVLMRTKAYRFGLFVEKYGKWEIDGLALKDFNGWRKKPDNEKFRFCIWAANVWTDYQGKLADPNGLAVN